MRLVSTKASTFGRIWVFVDSNKTEDVVSKADEKAAGARVYAYIVKPQDILDMGFDDEGKLDAWILVRETIATTPIRCSTGDVQALPAVEDRWRCSVKQADQAARRSTSR
jgi:hypothetical protein